jgi:hypothetical protein
MKKTIIIIMLALISTWSVASEISGAVAAYVHELFAAEYFRGLWKMSGFPRNDPNGGYLFRFELTFTTQEQRLEFIASDRFGETNRGIAWWNIYKMSAEGQWSKIATGVPLSVHEFYVNPATRTIIQPYPRGKFSTVKIGRDGSIQQKYHSPADEDATAQDEAILTGIPFKPTVEKVPIAAYLRSPDAEWRLLDHNSAASAQSLDAGDAPLLALGGDLSWIEALGLVQALPSGLNQPVRQPMQDAPALVNASPNSHTQKTTPPPRAETPTEGGTTMWPWALGIAALAVIGLLVWKRRS